MNRLIVQPAPKEHWGWLAMRSGCSVTDDFQAMEAVDSSGAVRGMVGFGNWLPNSVTMHVAVTWPICARVLVPPAFALPFLHRGVGVAICTVSSVNARSLSLVAHLGFRETGRIKDAIRPGQDLVFHEMRREECRWLPSEAFRKAS